MRYRALAFAVLSFALTGVAAADDWQSDPEPVGAPGTFVTYPDVDVRIASPKYGDNWEYPTVNPALKFNIYTDYRNAYAKWRTKQPDLVTEVYTAHWVDDYPGYFVPGVRVSVRTDPIPPTGDGTGRLSVPADWTAWPDGAYIIYQWPQGTGNVRRVDVIATRPLPGAGVFVPTNP